MWSIPNSHKTMLHSASRDAEGQEKIGVSGKVVSGILKRGEGMLGFWISGRVGVLLALLYICR